MGTLRRNARDGHAVEDREREAEQALSVGKRTLLGASHGSHTSDVGKRTATQRLKRRSREQAFAHAVAELRAWIPRLASALAANDFDAAATTALTIRCALEDAREFAGATERQALDALVAEADPLLARAPELSEEACRERYRATDKRPAWDAERRAWIGSV